MVHAGGALGLGRPEPATTFARNDRPPDVGGAGVQVDVAPGESKDLADSQSDREHDGDRGGVTVVVSLGDQVDHFIACEHPSRRAVHLGRLHAVDGVGANYREIDRGREHLTERGPGVGHRRWGEQRPSDRGVVNSQVCQSAICAGVTSPIGTSASGPRRSRRSRYFSTELRRRRGAWGGRPPVGEGGCGATAANSRRAQRRARAVGDRSIPAACDFVASRCVVDALLSGHRVPVGRPPVRSLYADAPSGRVLRRSGT